VNAWVKLAAVAAQYVHKAKLLQVSSEWLRPSAWVDQSGTSQVSVDMDANHLVLLDRAGNGDNAQARIFRTFRSKFNLQACG
jgi:single-stranded DNA-binding protein